MTFEYENEKVKAFLTDKNVYFNKSEFYSR